MFVLKVKIILSILSDVAVAFTTVNRSTFTGLERHFGFFTTLGAHGGEHLASGPVAIAIISVTLCSPRFAAWGTALGLVSVAF